MALSNLIYWNGQLAKTTPHVLRLTWKITAGKTVAPLQLGLPVLTSFDAIASQATIDTFLGTTSEFALNLFDSTAMGTDAFAGIINLMGGASGQAYAVGAMVANIRSGSNFATSASTAANAQSGMTASTLATEAALGGSGNLAFRIVSSGLDAITSGLLEVNFEFIAK